MRRTPAVVAIPLTLLALSCAATPSSSSSRQDLGDVYERVHRSVAVIRTVGETVPTVPGAQPTSEGGVGSGVLISRDGKVMTAAHVVQTANEIEVEFVGDRKWSAKVIGSSETADVALLQLDGVPTDDIPVVSLGDSDAAMIGDQVFVVGAPFGITHTLTVGHLSARRKQDMLLQGAEAEYLQTDAAINPGNSGGPMFNMNGEVIGLVSHIVSKSGGSLGIGFAVTSNLARKLLLERNAFWSGMSGQILSIKMASILNVPGGGGILVQKIAQNSPAERIGLRGGDIHATFAEQPLLVGGDVILAVLGKPVMRPTARDDIRQEIARMGPDDKIVVRVLRDGEMKDLSLTKSTFFGER